MRGDVLGLNIFTYDIHQFVEHLRFHIRRDIERDEGDLLVVNFPFHIEHQVVSMFKDVSSNTNRHVFYEKKQLKQK